MDTLASTDSPVLQCALVEGVGTLASALGQNFNGLELRALYALLAELGSPQWAVASCARAALWAVKEALQIEGGIPELVSKHSDRLADLLSQRLMALELYPNAPNVSERVVRCYWLILCAGAERSSHILPSRRGHDTNA